MPGAAERRPAASRSQSPSILAGSIQLIGMDEIRRSLGDHWAMVADKAQAVAERTIAQHLSLRRDNPLYHCLVDEVTGKHTLERLAKLSNADHVRDGLADLDGIVLGRAVEGLPGTRRPVRSWPPS
jgi:hypothetical protein